jgi:hypothetical protein
MEWLIVALLFVIAGLTAWLVRVANQILASLELNAEYQRVPPWERRPYHTCHGYGSMVNYSTWRYSKGGWQLVDKRITDEFDLGDPPWRPGAYEGEVVRRPAKRKQPL